MTNEVFANLTFKQIKAAASRFRKLELLNLKRENAVMRAELALARMTLPEPVASVPETITVVPTNMGDAIKHVINGTPLNSYELYTHVKEKFPLIRGGFETCKASIRDLRQSGFLAYDRGGKARGQYRKA